MAEVKIMSDRFFLEEIVFKLEKAEDHGGYLLEGPIQMLKDWMKEFIEELPLSEEERTAYIEDHYAGDPLAERYFDSEMALKEYL